MHRMSVFESYLLKMNQVERMLQSLLISRKALSVLKDTPYRMMSKSIANKNYDRLLVKWTDNDVQYNPEPALIIVFIGVILNH